jgi:hypothetical protein
LVPADVTTEDPLDEIVASISNRTCILFLGAGVTVRYDVQPDERIDEKE